MADEIRKAKDKVTTTLADLIDGVKRHWPEIQQAPRKGTSAAIQAYQTIGQLPEVLDGRALPTAPSMDMSWQDIQAWLNSQVDKGVGYYRGYIQPKLSDLFR